ncbi:FMN-binding glutamate synthase family protein [Mycolicibacterium parafortuitum]|uniref:Glutamate synthase family protein [Blastococcus saxobsidens DD2] n=1 Tax=Mycolicibacterium parafortuitum TaxID=39692 RepID=A0A375YD67_MYCPF|nr:FMN-binding glutamate synthase family protein [Mycolicibacterium parafortuitum]ORB31045.1 FMN-binding glutamate synthase family protein [Mycolicibacterium parafortuitum]SRX79072.1 glutamate synthase family protein [Blastococcus saxobsidens DD2] [Mycolicibacterium parafortuitum]
MKKRTFAALAPAAAVAGIALQDLLQKEHALRRNFPVLARARYLLEAIGPELRQYIITSNDAERPFSRDQRRWVYTSAKKENNYFAFGTDNDIENNSYPIIKHATFSDVAAASPIHGGDLEVPGAKILGGPRGRRHAFRPASVVNVSAMSFGSLSPQAIEAINKGAKIANFWHNTGEGGLSDHHRCGGDLVFQIGTGYFGCRDEHGRFDLDRLVDVVGSAPVRAIEIKLSQGAKPGLGGHLPGAKVNAEIARIRGVQQGKDVVSPSRHTAFRDVDEMLDIVEKIADATGLPVGIKSAVGEMGFWETLADRMADGQRGVDFVTIDGGEGGTGAAPLVFEDNVSFPFRTGFAQVYGLFAQRELTDRITWIGAGKLGLPANAIVAFALGVDLINVAREAMLAIGCIQAQKCHTDHCPTGVATQNPWLARGLDPEQKSHRMANYVLTLRRDLVKVSEAAGVRHPALLGPEHVEILDGDRGHRPLAEVYGYQPGWGIPGAHIVADINECMRCYDNMPGTFEVVEHAPVKVATEPNQATE